MGGVLYLYCIHRRVIFSIATLSKPYNIQTAIGVKNQITENLQKKVHKLPATFTLLPHLAAAEITPLFSIKRTAMMENLLGTRLLAAPGAAITTQDVMQEADVVLLYFSASW